MAIVEIAKIQIRRGDARTDGMPQLDTGEFGWAVAGTDPNSTQPELYIGNKSGQDGALTSTNTRVLTVLDLPNIFGNSVTTSTYYYSGHRSVTIHTGISGADNQRTVKDKLDDSLTFNDFILPADKVSGDYTATLQRAINELFLNSDKANFNARQPLVVPAGFYEISDTIYIPSYASIIGAGKDKTVFVLKTGSKVLFQFVDLTSTAGSPVVFPNMVSNTSPRNITISGCSLVYADELTLNSTLPLLRADCAQDCDITDVKFKGPVPYASSNNDSAGIDIRGSSGITSKNLRITECVFDSLRYGIKSDYDIEDTVIDNNRFQNLYRGIVYGETPRAGNQTGPVRSRITKNVFYTISQEAIKVVNSGTAYTNHILSQNNYVNVGNSSTFAAQGLGDIGGQTTSTVVLATYGNVSENETFQRFIEVNNTTTSVNNIIPIAGHVSLVDNKIRTYTFSNVAATGDIVKFAHSKSVTNLKIQYHINSAGFTRWGNLFIVCSNNLIVDVTDDYKFNGDSNGGITFDANFSSLNNNITVTYSGNTVSGTMTYQINQYY